MIERTKQEWELLRFELASNAPIPYQGWEKYMTEQRQKDHNLNPHNDGPPKPKLRSDLEIMCDWAWLWAEGMIERESIKKNRRT